MVNKWLTPRFYRLLNRIGKVLKKLDFPGVCASSKGSAAAGRHGQIFLAPAARQKRRFCPMGLSAKGLVQNNPELNGGKAGLPDSRKTPVRPRASQIGLLLKEIEMQLPQNTVIAVADGEKLSLFQNEGDAANVRLKAMPDADVDGSKIASGGRHSSSSANPDDSQQDEDGFTAGIAALLNKKVLDGKISNLVIIAAPRTLGEMRKSYHKSLSEILIGELDKDLTGHSLQDIEKALAAA
jgi:protein required for attachment to host cells